MVYRGTEELAENKLILLFLLSEIKSPLTKNQITQIVMENSLMNYFSMQHFLSQLVDKGLVKHYQDMGKHLYLIQDQGLDVLKLFSARIPAKLKEDLLEYFSEKGLLFKKEPNAQSSYVMEDQDTYTVCLRLAKKRSTVLDARIKASSEEDARKICQNWNANAETLYEDIVKILMEGPKD